MATFNENLALIKKSYNIVDFIESENISLKVSGPGEYKGLCPFHNEKTPSFKVSEPFQNYYCFGCHARGDIFTFISETRGCSLFEAAKYLAEMKGIAVEFDDKGKRDNGPKVDLRSLYSLLDDTYKFYRAEYEKLDENHPAKKEVKKRNLDVNDPMFGYAPEKYGALIEYLTNKGYSKDLMLQSEMIGEKDGNLFDFFRSRLMITLSDFSGRPVSFSARKLFESDTRAKFVNGKASPIFQKKATLFNLHNAKKSARLQRELILTEGPFDAKAIEIAGFPNVAASCGTAFTEEHLKTGRQLVSETGTLLFAFDGDSAGIEAALKVFTHFPIAHGVSKIVLFPEGKDPCDYYLELGSEGIREILNTATPITDFVLTELVKSYPLTDMASRYKFVQEIVSTYISIMTEPVLIDYMIRKTSVISGIELGKIKELYEKSKSNSKGRIAPELKRDEPELNMKIDLNMIDDSDVCFVNAFSLLVRFPDRLTKLSKGIDFPSKFQPFLKEFVTNFSIAMKEGRTFHFIAEEYNDIDFAKYLQNVSITKDYVNEDDELDSYYIHLLRSGEKFYKSSIHEAKKASILAAMNEAKSNEELLELLTLLKKYD